MVVPWYCILPISGTVLWYCGTKVLYQEERYPLTLQYPLTVLWYCYWIVLPFVMNLNCGLYGLVMNLVNVWADPW